MRIHRRALITMSFVALVAALTPTLAGSAAPAHKEVASSESSPILVTQPIRAQLITVQSLAPLSKYFDLVNQALAARAAAAQAQREAALSEQQAVLASYVVPAAPGGGWAQVAICEEGGRNDARYGYFGIEPGNWPSGESPATMDYAAQEQLANAMNGGHAPWCPPTCAAGGYRGW